MVAKKWMHVIYVRLRYSHSFFQPICEQKCVAVRLLQQHLFSQYPVLFYTMQYPLVHKLELQTKT